MRTDEQNGKENRQKENIGEKRNGNKMEQCKDNEQKETHSKEPVHIHRSSSVVAGQARARYAEPEVSSHTYFIQNSLVSACQPLSITTC